MLLRNLIQRKREIMLCTTQVLNETLFTCYNLSLYLTSMHPRKARTNLVERAAFLICRQTFPTQNVRSVSSVYVFSPFAICLTGCGCISFLIQSFLHNVMFESTSCQGIIQSSNVLVVPRYSGRAAFFSVWDELCYDFRALQDRCSGLIICK